MFLLSFHLPIVSNICRESTFVADSFLYSSVHRAAQQSVGNITLSRPTGKYHHRHCITLAPGRSHKSDRLEAGRYVRVYTMLSENCCHTLMQIYFIISFAMLYRRPLKYLPLVLLSLGAIEWLSPNVMLRDESDLNHMYDMIATISHHHIHMILNTVALITHSPSHAHRTHTARQCFNAPLVIS